MPEGLVSLSHGPLHYRHAPCTRSRAVAVLLHGLLATSFGWRATLAALSTRCNSFALDLPGLAASAPLPGYRASLARLAGCVAEFWQARGLPRGVLIGSSWGGAVALETAARFPHLIDRLVLAAPLNPFFRPNWRQRLLLRPRLARYGAELLRRAPRRLYAAGFAAMWSGPRPLPPEMLAGYWRPLRQARWARSSPAWSPPGTKTCARWPRACRRLTCLPCSSGAAKIGSSRPTPPPCSAPPCRAPISCGSPAPVI